jgi:capsular polysaccharide transport system permease protein
MTAPSAPNDALTLRTTGRGLLVQLHVVHALILRETRTRFGLSQLGYLWALIEPLLWIGTIAGMYVLGGSTGKTGMTMVGFIGTGIITYELFRNCQSRVMVAVSSNMPLLFYPQVQPLDMMISRVLLEYATWFSVFVVILGGDALVRGELRVDDPLKVILGLFLAGALGGSLGAVLCSLTVYSNSIDKFAGALLRPLMFMSGTFFALEDMPAQVVSYLVYNPVLHVVELVRDGWYRTYTSTHVNAWYPSLWIVGFTFLALTLERVVRPKLQVT